MEPDKYCTRTKRIVKDKYMNTKDCKRQRQEQRELLKTNKVQGQRELVADKYKDRKNSSRQRQGQRGQLRANTRTRRTVEGKYKDREDSCG